MEDGVTFEGALPTLLEVVCELEEVEVVEEA